MSPDFVALLVVCSVFGISKAQDGCSWETHLNTNAPGGEPQMHEYTADECKAACLNSESTTGRKCYAVDHQPLNKWCWFFYNTDFKEQASNDMNHYNYKCTAVCRDQNILTDASKANCIGTNYPGNPQDFFTQVTSIWTYSLPSVTFSFSNKPTIRKISYDSADNLQAFRARVKTPNGDVWTQSTTGKSLSVNVKDVIQVTIYFAPIDLSRNVTVRGLAVATCPGGLVGDVLCLIFSVVDLSKAIVSALFCGTISFDSQGKCTLSVGFQAPYIDVDLVACLGISASKFSKISFGQAQNITSVAVLVSNSGNAVPVTDSSGNPNPLPYPATGITLGGGITGDHITLTITPQTLSIQQPVASFSFTGVSITIC